MNAINLINTSLLSLNQSKLLLGVSVVLMNLGSRYVVSDITKIQEKLLSTKAMKVVIIFCMFFITTRDIHMSVLLTIGFIIMISGLMNENSKYNLVTFFGILTEPENIIQNANTNLMNNKK